MGTERFGCFGWDRSSIPFISACRNFPIGMLALLLLLSQWTLSAAAQELQVLVNDAVYVVNGSEVARQKGSEPIGDETHRQALLTARVLNDLHSDFNKEFFSPANRAAIFADQASGRLVESWQRPLAESSSSGSRAGELALAAAKDRFKAWAVEAAANPNKLALAVVRTDYLNGIDAYRENAAIYRKIVKQNATLSYSEAMRFLSNQFMTAKLANARNLEEQLMASAPGKGLRSKAELGQPGDLRELSSRMETEVIGRIGQIRSAADLEKASQHVARIAESSVLRGYRDSVKPPIIRLSGDGGRVGAKRESPDTLSNVSGGASERGKSVANAPADQRAAPAPQGSSAAVPGRQQAPSEQMAANGGGAGEPKHNAVGADRPENAPRDQAPIGASGPGEAPARQDAVDSRPRSSGLILAGGGDNLQTYSSKGYHSPDGLVFNPSTALWENPADPTQTRIPAVMLCCDDTGLSFPGDSLEAHRASSGEWDGASVDPNCGRLYSCGPVKTSSAPAIDPASPGPTDRDQEILRAVQYLEQLPEDDRDEAVARFIVGLPSEYRRRAILAVRQNQQRRANPQNAPAKQAGTPSAGPRAKLRHRKSDVSGPGQVSSRYQPVTQTSAQTIVSKYKSIPGGVTLEGVADLKFVKKVVYLAKANAFILDDDVVYVNPVTADELAEIANALAADDKLGVSLGAGSSLVYGALPKNGRIVRNLKIADRFLGAITFSNPELANYKFLPGYNTRRSISRDVAVYFNINDVGLTETDEGELKRSRISLATTLVPLVSTSAAGGHLPDPHRIARGDVSPSDEGNLKHLQENIGYYARERIVRTALAYGEVAAFARAMKAANLKLDLK